MEAVDVTSRVSSESTWGGAREGSGRKPLSKTKKKVQVTCQVDPDVAKALKRSAKARKLSISALVNEVLGEVIR